MHIIRRIFSAVGIDRQAGRAGFDPGHNDSRVLLKLNKALIWRDTLDLFLHSCKIKW